jgi:hypothetical protein
LLSSGGQRIPEELQSWCVGGGHRDDVQTLEQQGPCFKPL